MNELGQLTECGDGTAAKRHTRDVTPPAWDYVGVGGELIEVLYSYALPCS